MNRKMTWGAPLQFSQELNKNRKTQTTETNHRGGDLGVQGWGLHGHPPIWYGTITLNIRRASGPQRVRSKYSSSSS